MKKITYILCAAWIIVATSCSDWLNVRPEEQFAAGEMFESYSGFCDILNGCYIKLKERGLYGEKLTMTDVEQLAALWREPSEVGLPGARELRDFNYAGDNAKAVIEGIYAGLYNAIANANMIINNIDARADVFPDEAARAVIAGEAYAIRAFCHFDALRLFGQLPKNPTRQVALPYAEEVSIASLPAYRDYDAFVARIEADLTRAEALLKNNDPLFSYTFAELNAGADDDNFMNFRQARFNYWAACALQARFYLYTGNTNEAYRIAKSIIEARGVDGELLVTLSGARDITAGHLTCPSECLLMLNAYDLESYFSSVFALGSYAVMDTHHAIAQEQLNALFDGQNIASNNRYMYVWEKTSGNPTGVVFPTLKKYYSAEIIYAGLNTLLVKRQVIPLIRLSEIYLIAMETTGSLAEANALWVEYQLSHNVLVEQDYFTSLADVRPKVLDEYRRELFGEGQMFYAYKRVGASAMLWRVEEVAEGNYILPLPETEFNPNL
ncbi:MAG: RagB/SusD family nutrient uptake outer membrane protein [Odoribacteraceae bacterium]|jgi:hypothetical protein|nr:RagB/SusD family nutrient uptake outer membrane protein [Odoribacteraceae bacterium]